MRAMHRCALTAGALALAACATARRGEPFTGEHRPPDEQIALGQRAFAANCSSCHPGGQQGIGPALNDKPLPVWAMKFQVRHGLGAMPAFSDEEMPDAELDAVVKYLKWLRGLDFQQKPGGGGSDRVRG